MVAKVKSFVSSFKMFFVFCFLILNLGKFFMHWEMCQ